MGEEPEYVTVAEFATVFRVSKMTVLRKIHDGELKAIAIGRSFRIEGTEMERVRNEGL